MVKLPSPEDENEFWAWIMVAMILYLAAAYVWRWWKTGSCAGESTQYITRVFDSATFAGSGMLLLGIKDQHILTLIGNTKPFLILAGLAGLIYAIHALPPK